MQNSEVILEVIKVMKAKFHGEETGHDWYHIERVWKNAKLIASKENCNSFIVELGALLHDIADHKFVDNYNEEAERRTRSLLENLEVSERDIDAVLHIVHNCSFKGGIGENKMASKEGLVVQDADRLDAIGAIGIARTFAYGAKHGNAIYDPEVGPAAFKTEEEYRNNRTHTVNHFYEKLLLLKDKMNTNTAKQLAAQRHDYMENFLEQFYAEWEGKL